MAQSSAEKIASGDKSPKELQEAIDEVTETAARTDGYAYRFEELGDGSCVAVFKTSPKGKVRYKAFESLKDTRYWHPESNIEGTPPEDTAGDEE